MTLASDLDTGAPAPDFDDLPATLAEAAKAADILRSKATETTARLVKKDGKLDNGLLEQQQAATHGVAWFATYAESIKQLADYAQRMRNEDRFGPLEAMLAQAAAGEYLAQMAGGIPMSQGEFVRPATLGLSVQDVDAFHTDAVRGLIASGTSAALRAALIAKIDARHGAGSVGDTGLEDTYEAMREEMRRFSQAEVEPHAHEWHLQNDYIPLEIIEKMSELGVFGLTIPEEHGGLGLGKESMCVVSEELSRGYIGVGSLGTRSEIAAELILNGGTEAQKEAWLPRIATGEILPTAVFTEPNIGSDLASLKTRAVRDGDVYRITGQKTWITHPVRADLMTLLARTNPDEPGYRGLSMFLVEKPRGTDDNPFPRRRHDRGRNRSARLSRYEGVRYFV